jgi:hypothetical protein
MPDITMCQGGACPIRRSCYRHTARPSKYRQSYFAAPPFQVDDATTVVTCEHYVSNGAVEKVEEKKP